MLLTILGSGTALPVAHRGPSGSWVRSDQTSILVDCGSGVTQKLLRAGGDLVALNAVLLSHAHIDHLGDFPTLLFGMRMLGSQRREPLHVLHHERLTSYLDGLRATFGHWLEPETFEVRHHALSPGDSEVIDDLQVATYSTGHHDTSLGFRIRGPSGESLAIPSDTGLSQALMDGVRGVDTLLVECSTPDDRPVEGHLCPADVLSLLREAEPGGAILTHLYPEAEAAEVVSLVRSAAACPVWEARDGLSVRIARGGFTVVSDAMRTPSDRLAPAGSVGGQPQTRSADAEAWAAALGEASQSKEDIQALIEAHVAGLDQAAIRHRKFESEELVDGPPEPPQPRRHWKLDALRGLHPHPRQRQLLKRAAALGRLPEVNLRGRHRDEAITMARAAIQTWAASGVELVRIITGKGKRSEDVPVIKVAVLDWLDGDEGGRWIEDWAAELDRDRNFGSVVVALKRRR